MDGMKFDVKKHHDSVIKSSINILKDIDSTNIDIDKLNNEINKMRTTLTLYWAYESSYIGDTEFNLGIVDKLISKLKKEIIVVNDLFHFKFAYVANDFKRKDRVENDILVDGDIMYGKYNVTDLDIGFVMLDLDKINNNQDKIVENRTCVYKHGNINVKSIVKRIKLRR